MAWDWVLGILAGILLGCIPSLHVNTLAVLALALAWSPQAVLAAAGAHAMTSLLPTLYLGAPGEENALAALPAHRLLLDGHGPQALRVALNASVWGFIFAVLLLVPVKWLFLEPLRLGSELASIAKIVVLILALWIIWGHRKRSLGHLAWACIIFILAGALGLVATDVGLDSPFNLPASPLLPTLTGAFAAAGLLESLVHAAPPPPQQPVKRIRIRSVPLRGTLASAVAVVVSGLTPGTAALLGRWKSGDAYDELGLVSSINTAHTVLTVAWLSWTGQARTGLTQSLPAIPTPQILSVNLTEGLLMMGLGIAAAYVACLALQPGFIWLSRNAARPAAGIALAWLVALVWAFTGLSGLALFAVATIIGLLPILTHTRRLNLTAILVVPYLAR